MPISRERFIGGAAAVVGASAVPIASSVPALAEAAHPFAGMVLVDAVKAAARSEMSWHYGATHEMYYSFSGLPTTGHTGGFPRWRSILVGKDQASGRWLAAIPMACGGTAGVTMIAVFAESPGGPKFVGAIRHGHKEFAYFENGSLHGVSAVFSAGDCNASPSGRRVVRYHLKGDVLTTDHEVVVASSEFFEIHETRVREGALLDVQAFVPDRPETHERIA